MSSEEIASRLMEAVIQRDEAEAARVSIELCSSPRLQWHFLRWESLPTRFRRIWPEPAQAGLSFASQRFDRLEKGEILVDNMGPGRAGMENGGTAPPPTILVPLLCNSQLQGALHGFSLDDSVIPSDCIEPLRPNLRLVSQAWFLAGLLDEKEELAFTDQLTRLRNADYLIHILKAEVARCARYGRSVAVAFLDIDWFKRVNDIHGHLTGSRVLCEFADLLRTNVRASDSAVRYGGDEFVLVLTETGEKAALELAERLRDKIEQHVFGQELGKSIRFTVSLGVAVYPQHGTKADDLIHQADLAMYVAKHNAKNCVKLAVQ